MTTFKLTTAKVADVQISNDGKTVYTSSDDGYLRAYSTATGALITSWHVGTDLGRMDLSPDGSFLMVIEDTPLSTISNPWYPTYNVAVYRVNLATGMAQTFIYTTQTNSEYTFFDVGVVTANKVLLSEGGPSGSSGGSSAELLDLTTGQFAVPGSYPNSYLTNHSWISATPDGSKVLIGEGNISDAELDIYVSGAGITTYDAGSGSNVGVQAISNDGNLVAQYVYGSGINIYDGSLHKITNLNSLHPEWAGGNALGLVFDATGGFLYVLNTGSDTIDKVATSDWHTVSTIALGFDAGTYPQFYQANDDLLQLDSTGHFFTVMSPSGLQSRLESRRAADHRHRGRRRHSGHRRRRHDQWARGGRFHHRRRR